MENRIHTLFFVPHTTHWAQPLDDKVLASLKFWVAALKRTEVFDRVATATPLDGVVQAVIRKAETLSFTPQVIQAAFRDTGVWPWKKSVFRARAEAALGISSSESPVSDTTDVAALAQKLMTQLVPTKSPGKEKRSTLLPDPNKCYTDEDVIAATEARAAAKVAKANSGKKRKHSTETTPTPKRVKVAEKIAADATCLACEADFVPTDESWTCPECGIPLLCRSGCNERFFRDLHERQCAERT